MTLSLPAGYSSSRCNNPQEGYFNSCVPMGISNPVYMCMNIGRQSMKIVKRDVFTVK